VRRGRERLPAAGPVYIGVLEPKDPSRPPYRLSVLPPIAKIVISRRVYCAAVGLPPGRARLSSVPVRRKEGRT
jgi:hypothetical protein